MLGPEQEKERATSVGCLDLFVEKPCHFESMVLMSCYQEQGWAPFPSRLSGGGRGYEMSVTVPLAVVLPAAARTRHFTI